MKNSKKIKENGKKVRIGKQYAAQGADGESFDVSGGDTRIFSSLAELLSGALSSGKDIKAIAYAAVRSIALGFIAFFFGRTSLLLDTYTLGISLLAASGSSVIPIFIGALVSAFAVKGGQGVLFSSKIYVCAYVLVLLIRISSRVLIDPAENFSAKTLLSPEKRKGALYALYSSLFGENVYLRMTSACAAAFFVSLWVLIEGEYRYYDLFSAMFAMISAPAITFLMSGFWREVRDKTDRFLLWVAEGTMLTAIVLSAKSTAVFGVNVGIFVAFLAILFFTERRGVLFSSALGLFMGLAFSPIYSPAFILAAVGAFVMKSSRFAICSVASLVALLWVAYIDGILAFTLFLPALITASVVFYALKAPASFSASDFAERRSYVETKGLVLEDASIKIEMLEQTFASIAKDLYAITERRRYPSFAAVSAVTRECFEERCSYCKMKRACRGEISDLVSKMSEIILRDGRIKKDSLPSFALDSCSHIMEIAEEANLNYGRLMVRHLESEKTRLFAVDYEGFSHILADVAEQVKRENTIDAELTERLRALCGRGGLGMEKIYVYGDRKKKIYCGNIGKKAEKKGVLELKKEIEESLGFPITLPVFEIGEERIALRAEAAERFEVSTCGASRAGRGETVCGDSYQLFEKNGKSFALICDGMGSGTEAEITSRISVSFLRQMLEGGNRAEISIKMLNNLLRSGSTECSAGLDLIELDRISGHASFVKSGAAPSFVRRGDKLYKLRSATAPIGIMNAIDAEHLSFEVMDGDLIIMMSDGMGASPEDNCELMELLGGEIGEDMDYFAQSIIDTALKTGEDDDATVLILRISEKKDRED